MSKVRGFEDTHLEEINYFTVREGVSECWDSAIGVDIEKPGFFLSVFRYIDFGDFNYWSIWLG